MSPWFDPCTAAEFHNRAAWQAWERHWDFTVHTTFLTTINPPYRLAIKQLLRKLGYL